MTSDLDIDRAANVLVQKHGEDAPIHAAMRADEMLEAGAWRPRRRGSVSSRRSRSCDSGSRATEPYTDAGYLPATKSRAWLIQASTLAPRDNLPGASRTCSGVASADWA